MGSGTSSDSAAGSGDGSDAATEVDTGEEDGSDPTGIADLPSEDACEEMWSQERGFTVAFDPVLPVPGEYGINWSGTCVLDQLAPVAEGFTSLLSCQGDDDLPRGLAFDFSEAELPSGLVAGSSYDVSVQYLEGTGWADAWRVILKDADGLVYGGVMSGGPWFNFGELTAEFASTCTLHEVEDGGPKWANGQIRVSGDAELVLNVGDIENITAAGHDFRVHARQASDVICCHGPTIGLTILRKPVEDR